MSVDAVLAVLAVLALLGAYCMLYSFTTLLLYSTPVGVRNKVAILSVRAGVSNGVVAHVCLSTALLRSIQPVAC